VGGEVLDRVVPHGVVERNFLAENDGLAGNQVMSTTGVRSDSTVWLTRVVHLGDKSTVQHKTVLADLRSVGVVVVEFAIDATHQHRLTELEGSGGEHTFSPVARHSQFESVIHRRLLPASASREDDAPAEGRLA
jgi:hypothetical protein